MPISSPARRSVARLSGRTCEKAPGLDPAAASEITSTLLHRAYGETRVAFRPEARPVLEALLARASALEAKYLKLAGDGRFELFKSTTNFDGPVHRKQHGFEVTA